MTEKQFHLIAERSGFRNIPPKNVGFFLLFSDQVQEKDSGVMNQKIAVSSLWLFYDNLTSLRHEKKYY